MRYQEITELHAPNTRQEAAKLLLKAGYRKVGDGGSGVVFRKPGVAGVLKLYDAADEGYSTFVEMVRNNPNPHFPKFLGKMRVLGNYYAVRIEELSPIPYDWEDDVDMIDEYIIAKTDSGTNWNDLRLKSIVKFLDQQPDLQRACDLIAGLIIKAGSKFMSDVRTPNVMMRGDTLVITDPIETDTL